jgi:hypothetical protein
VEPAVRRSGNTGLHHLEQSTGKVARPLMARSVSRDPHEFSAATVSSAAFCPPSDTIAAKNDLTSNGSRIVTAVATIRDPSG